MVIAALTRNVPVIRRRQKTTASAGAPTVCIWNVVLGYLNGFTVRGFRSAQPLNPRTLYSFHRHRQVRSRGLFPS